MLTSFVAVFVAALDLAAEFAEPEDWKRPVDAFVSDRRADGFRFASDRHDIANSLRRGAVTWNGLEVWEAKLYAENNVATRYELSMYNRGDDRDGRPLDAAALKSLLARIAAAAEPNGVIGRQVEMRKLPSGGYRYERRFAKGADDVVLTWGVDSVKTKDQTADYVRVTVRPKGAAKAKSAGVGVAKAKARSNVSRNESGDVWIDSVPMVDQGQKGYCACAVAERVLRYYGKTVDEHEIAQMAGTTAAGGTSFAEMVETVRKVGSKNRLGFQSVVTMSGSVKDIEKEVAQYNKHAKALKAPAIDMRAFTRGHVIMVGEINDQMRSDVILRMRTKDSRFKKFLSGVKMQIDKGIPVFWGVTLGKFPEPEIPQASGGHMRLIIGYNAKAHTIIYTDTWGAGHERKSMPEDQAFAITHAAFALKPL